MFEGVVTLITKWQVANGVWLEFSRGVVSSIVEFCDSPSAGAVKSLVSSRLVGCAGISQMQCTYMSVLCASASLHRAKYHLVLLLTLQCRDKF